MIDAQLLLNDLKTLLKKLEADLLERCKNNPAIDAQVHAEFEKAERANRTAQAYEDWRTDFITQVAVAWILGCVFVRFIEDNHLLDDQHEARAWLAGPRERLQLAQDRHTVYFREHPTESDREYLEHVFHSVGDPTGKRPIAVVQALFDERHNPLWKLGVSGDGAGMLLKFWQERDAASGELKHDFTDAEWNTRFLGDLYQDLSEAARKKYALLQTPIFVEEFILDRTLTPAIQEFGYEQVRLIDPTCGSGHFLLGAFARLFDLHLKNNPAINARELAQRALRSVYGVDVNPFAVAIARFRLLMAALKAAETNRLQDAPDFTINVATGDSLLHGKRRELTRYVRQSLLPDDDELQHHYETEDKELLDKFLGQQYHAVVGNPPYITVKDKALNQAYRERFSSCHRQYSLAVPFMERFFDLAIRSENGAGAGYIGMITANSFMKREFGKKLIEQFIPLWDLTHVVDTSGAYIPGHGTPTVILLGRHRRPVAETIRTVMGIKGEPSTPADPTFGKVWRSIVENIDLAGAQTEFVSVADTQRESFHRHPWIIGGGGTAELKEVLDDAKQCQLGDEISSIGFYQDTHADEAFVQPYSFVKRHSLQMGFRDHIRGEEVRDWHIGSDECICFPYNEKLEQWLSIPLEPKWWWFHALRTVLWNRSTFGGGTYLSEKRPWFDYHQFPKDRARSPLLISFACVATHNHFVLDRGGKIFNRHAPVIKLASEATEDDHYVMLSLLNSSTACFWMKQVMSCKGLGGQGGGIKPEDWHRAYEFDGTKLKAFPLPQKNVRLLELSRKMNDLALQASKATPQAVLLPHVLNISIRLHEAHARYEKLHHQMVALQEEMDWLIYSLYGICDYQLVSSEVLEKGLHPEERPVEIALQEKIAGGEQSIFYEVHKYRGTKRTNETLSQEMQNVIHQRIQIIQTNPLVGLIETINHKRRWQIEPWENQEARALREWLLNRLEDARYWPQVTLTSVARLADLVRSDSEWMQVAEMYRGRSDFEVLPLVTELVKAEAVPFLPVFRYKPAGLEKRAVWERTWELQRQEDAIDARTKLAKEHPQYLTAEAAKKLKAEEIGDIPVPPKYKSTDFRDTNYWRLRGKLDVPKERFISFPNCEREVDSTLVIGWAGWNHLEQAQAIANYYTTAKEREGWSPARLVALLAGLVELLPWVLQWHNEMDATYGMGLGDFFQEFVEEEARGLGLTINKIREWEPID